MNCKFYIKLDLIDISSTWRNVSYLSLIQLNSSDFLLTMVFDYNISILVHSLFSWNYLRKTSEVFILFQCWLMVWSSWLMLISILWKMYAVARAQITFQKYLPCQSTVLKNIELVRELGMNPKVGGSSPPQVETFSVSKSSTLAQEHRQSMILPAHS